MLDEATKRRVQDLCDLIAREQDHHRFSQLIAELDQVLEASDLNANKGRQDSVPVRSDGKAQSSQGDPI